MSVWEDLKNNLMQVIVGGESTIDYVITAFMCGGHVLLEDMPGTGKTTLAKAMASSMDMEFSRIQFTPDLMPSDVTGLHVYNQKNGDFEFHKGPVFTNILLADEVNRATPRTQSSLLECMEEHQISLDGTTFALAEPFFVIATQNPIETAGTFPLPEAQLDRFLMRLSLGMVSGQEEKELLRKKLTQTGIEELSAVCTAADWARMRQEVMDVFVHEEIMTYICHLCDATRNRSDIIAGVSPRGAIALMRASQAYACIHGRHYVIPEDVKALAIPVLAHRLVLLEGFSPRAVYEEKIQSILEQVPVPTEDWTH